MESGCTRELALLAAAAPGRKVQAASAAAAAAAEQLAHAAAVGLGHGGAGRPVQLQRCQRRHARRPPPRAQRVPAQAANP